MTGRLQPRIAAVQGATNPAVQGALWRFARRWSARGVTIAGLVETFSPDGLPLKRGTRLENVRTWDLYPLFQHLGSMAAACHLDGAGVVDACQAICQEIERGCDLVVLSKFGRLEALRSGLIDAFAAATARNIPILTSVSPTYQLAWEAFSAPLSVLAPADDGALDKWWSAVRPESRLTPSTASGRFCDETQRPHSIEG